MNSTYGRPRLGAWSTLLVVGVALYGGCSWNSSPVHFYVLAASRQTAPAPSTAREPGPTIGVGPITLPRYLERNNIVTRRDAELEVAEGLLLHFCIVPAGELGRPLWRELAAALRRDRRGLLRALFRQGRRQAGICGAERCRPT